MPSSASIKAGAFIPVRIRVDSPDLSLERDVTLVQHLRSGSPEAANAYGELYRRYWPIALTAGFRHAGPSSADDVAQDALLGVLRAISAGGGPTESFASYVVVAVRNQSRTVARRSREAVAGGADEVEVLRVRETTPEPVATDSHGDRQVLAQAFHALPARYRAILWETVVEGWPLTLIARREGISQNSVAVAALRAREQLRRAWLEAEADAPRLQPSCTPTRQALIRQVRGDGLRTPRANELAHHIDTCPACTEVKEHVRALARQLPPRGPRSDTASSLWPEGRGSARER